MLVRVDSVYFTCNLYIYIYTHTNAYMKITKTKRILKKKKILLKKFVNSTKKYIKNLFRVRLDIAYFAEN